MSSQPWKGRVTRQEIELGIPTRVRFFGADLARELGLDPIASPQPERDEREDEADPGDRPTDHRRRVAEVRHTEEAETDGQRRHRDPPVDHCRARRGDRGTRAERRLPGRRAGGGRGGGRADAAEHRPAGDEHRDERDRSNGGVLPAVEANADRGEDQRRRTEHDGAGELLAVTRGEGERVRVEVTDNGEGIPTQNLARIFNHGFTTKKSGHGFGLHISALAAAELQGRLTCTSPGPGQGATFTLELPLEAAT